MKTKILYRKRILSSLFLIIFCTAVLRFILEGMASGYQRMAGSQVIMYRFIFPFRLVFANFLSWGTVCWEKFGLLLGNIWLLFKIINIPFSSAAGEPYPEHTYYLLCPVIALTCALMYTPSASAASLVADKLKINCNHCLLITTYFESSSI